MNLSTRPSRRTQPDEIRTQYVGPRGLKGSKIVARWRGRQLTIGYRPELGMAKSHRLAAERITDDQVTLVDAEAGFSWWVKG